MQMLYQNLLQFHLKGSVVYALYKNTIDVINFTVHLLFLRCKFSSIKCKTHLAELFLISCILQCLSVCALGMNTGQFSDETHSNWHFKTRQNQTVLFFEHL